MTTQQQQQQQQQMIPDDFKCPISLEVMSDPVILSSGHTFDRPSIQRWLDAGHRSCPISNQPLPHHPTLIPNHVLRSLISSFSPQQTLTPQQPKPTSLLQTLAQPTTSDPDSKITALTTLTKLCKRDIAFRRKLIENGVVGAVLRCLESGEGKVVEKGLNLLLNLSLDDDSKVGLVAEGVIGRVVGVLRSGESGDGRALAATLLTSLAVVEVNKATIGAYPGAVRGLVRLLSEGKARERKEAATALYALCAYPENRRWAVECGAVRGLVRLADAGVERAVEVLGVLGKCREGREEMRRVEGCVEVLARVVRVGSGRGVQYALLTLFSLCCGSEEVCREVRELGVVECCLGLLEDENEKIRRNADALIQVLQGN